MSKKLSIASLCVVLGLAALSANAIAAPGSAGHAKGKTHQGRAIRMKVMPNAVRILGFSIELHCSGGYILVDQESGFKPTAVTGSGHLRDRQWGSTDEVLLRGHLKGHTVRGQTRVRDRLGKHRCSSPWVKFTARRHG